MNIWVNVWVDIDINFTKYNKILLSKLSFSIWSVLLFAKEVNIKQDIFTFYDKSNSLRFS